MIRAIKSLQRSLGPGAILGILSTAILATPAYAGGDEPAGGAAIGEVIIATVAMSLLTGAVLAAGAGHRSGRISWLGRASDFTSRVSGLPGWAALPSAVSTVSLITAVFGMYWDISLHIDVGRDAGPLANPAHYFILAGLFGIFTAGFLAMVLPREHPGPSAIRITRSWHAPLGGVLIFSCGAFSLIGFPLDDFWHRLFGQDVTLWGPTHLMLIGGASMTLFGQAVLLVEGMRASPAGRRGDLAWVVKARRVGIMGGLLIGLSTFQAEFDFGVPQFRFLFQPLLIMIAAGVGLTLARVWVGPGGALGAAAFFLGVRGLLAVTVGPVLGETTPHFPLYLVEAAVVEVIALRVATDRPLRFGAWAGLGIGTVGLAGEWAWSHVFMPLPWPSELLPEAAVLGLVAALAASLLGGWAGGRLKVGEAPREPASRFLAPAAALAIAALVAYGLYTPSNDNVTAQVALTEVQSGPERTVAARVKLDPPDAADDAAWLTATAWQGDGLVLDRLERVGPGEYRTTQPIPVHGNWKSLLRLQSGNSIQGVPVFLPEDRAIPAKGVPAEAQFTRTFVHDKKILQREAKESSPGLVLGALGVVFLIAVGLLALIAWGLHRLAATASAGGRREPPAPEEPPAPAREPRFRPELAAPSRTG